MRLPETPLHTLVSLWVGEALGGVQEGGAQVVHPLAGGV